MKQVRHLNCLTSNIFQLETILELISAPEKPPKENPSDVASDEEDKEKLDASSVSSSSSSSSEESSSDEEDVYLPRMFFDS